MTHFKFHSAVNPPHCHFIARIDRASSNVLHSHFSFTANRVRAADHIYRIVHALSCPALRASARGGGHRGHPRRPEKRGKGGVTVARTASIDGQFDTRSMDLVEPVRKHSSNRPSLL